MARRIFGEDDAGTLHIETDPGWVWTGQGRSYSVRSSTRHPPWKGLHPNHGARQVEQSAALGAYLCLRRRLLDVRHVASRRVLREPANRGVVLRLTPMVLT
jgi:hypothetical protein